MLSNCIFYKKRKTLLFSCVVFLMVHLYKFTNYLPNWDSMYGMKIGKLGMIHFGRWFSGIAEILTSSVYDLQWVCGIASAFFIGLTVVLLLDLLHIENKHLKAVATLLFVAFPSMAATQTYSLWASSYMLALFLSVLGVYICAKHTKYFYYSIPCFALSMGIYQIYILFAGATAIYYFANILLDPDEKIRNYKKPIIAGAVSFLTGVMVYVIVDKVLRTVFDIELSTYQGISNAGKMSLNSILLGIKRIAVSIIKFFLSDSSITFYGYINISIALLIIVLVMWKIVFNSRYSVFRRIVLCVMLASAMPITYAFYLISEGVQYHMLMELGNYFVYLVPILIFEKNGFKIGSKAVLAIITALLGVLGMYHFINDNISYHQLNMSYERTSFQMTETLSKIDSVNNYHYQKIAVFGHYPLLDDGINAIPIITGAGTSSFITGQIHFVQFAKYYMNREFVSSTDEEKAVIEKTSEYSNMTEYPYGNYVSVIDGVIVVKLSE